MPVISPIVIGIGVAVAGGVAAADASRRQTHAIQEQNRLETEARKQEQKLAENANRQQRITAIRRARAASANVRQTAVNTGSSTSTSAEAAISNPFVRVGSELSFQNQQIGFMRARNAFLSRATEQGNIAAAQQGKIQLGNTIQGIGLKIFDAGGGFKEVFN